MTKNTPVTPPNQATWLYPSTSPVDGTSLPLLRKIEYTNQFRLVGPSYDDLKNYTSGCFVANTHWKNWHILGDTLTVQDLFWVWQDDRNHPHVGHKASFLFHKLLNISQRIPIHTHDSPYQIDNLPKTPSGKGRIGYRHKFTNSFKYLESKWI